MPKLSDLSPEQMLKFADATESAADDLPRSEARDRMMFAADRLRAKANMTSWLEGDCLTRTDLQSQ